MGDILVPPSLGFANISWRLRSTSRSSGQSFEGQEQIILSPTGRWTATATFNVFSGAEDSAALAYRSLIRRGRAAEILLPETDTRNPIQFAGLVIPANGVRHSDGASFSDGAGYDQSFTWATLAASASVSATQIQINLPSGLTLIPGMRFSTPDGRLHEIDDILSSSGSWGVLICPRLRAGYGAGTALNFDRPVCRMRLATDDTGSLSVSQRALSTPSIDFVEAL